MLQNIFHWLIGFCPELYCAILAVVIVLKETLLRHVNEWESLRFRKGWWWRENGGDIYCTSTGPTNSKSANFIHCLKHRRPYISEEECDELSLDFRENKGEAATPKYGQVLEDWITLPDLNQSSCLSDYPNFDVFDRWYNSRNQLPQINACREMSADTTRESL